MVFTVAQSLSSAISSTKASTWPQSPSLSVSPVGQDFQGAFHATGGLFQGRALGNVRNWANTKHTKLKDALGGFAKPTGKVLLYTSQEKGALPAMMITHETVYQLPPILEKMSHKFSPIQSK